MREQAYFHRLMHGQPRDFCDGEMINEYCAIRFSLVLWPSLPRDNFKFDTCDKAIELGKYLNW